MSPEKKSLYERLGGYDAISAVANDLLPRLQGDPQLGRFWAHRGLHGEVGPARVHVEHAIPLLGPDFE